MGSCTRGQVRGTVPSVRDPVEMRRPEMVRELMQFLQVAHLMWLSLPHMPENVAPLRALIKRQLQCTKRTKRVANRKVISEEDRSEVFQTTWQKSRELLKDAV